MNMMDIQKMEKFLILSSKENVYLIIKEEIKIILKK
jgi:hypothetical protein